MGEKKEWLGFYAEPLPTQSKRGRHLVMPAPPHSGGRRQGTYGFGLSKERAFERSESLPRISGVGTGAVFRFWTNLRMSKRWTRSRAAAGTGPLKKAGMRGREVPSPNDGRGDENHLVNAEQASRKGREGRKDNPGTDLRLH